jgi:hypothetical protein
LGVDAAGQPPAHQKKNIVKKPTGKLTWVGGTKGLMGEEGLVEED